MSESNHLPNAYNIIKAKIKNDRITAEYEEVFTSENYINSVSKSSEQIAHADLVRAFDYLKPHLVALCEFPEAQKINIANPTDEDLDQTLAAYKITGYTKGGSSGSEGVTIIGQRLLLSGNVLNLVTPFTKFQCEMDEGYTYGLNLKECIDRLDYEVDAYLFEGKFGMKQTSLDFDTPEESKITIEVTSKKGRKKKTSIEALEQAIDEAV